jgi:hypothetical protein
MKKPEHVVDDPDVLAGVVRAFGGVIVPGESFTFDLPRASVRDILPRLHELGISARRVSERTEMNPKAMTVTRLTLYKPSEW